VVQSVDISGTGVGVSIQVVEVVAVGVDLPGRLSGGEPGAGGCRLSCSEPSGDAGEVEDEGLNGARRREADRGGDAWVSDEGSVDLRCDRAQWGRQSAAEHPQHGSAEASPVLGGSNVLGLVPVQHGRGLAVGRGQREDAHQLAEAPVEPPGGLALDVERLAPSDALDVP